MLDAGLGKTNLKKNEDRFCYVVGAGTFAVKVSHVLVKHNTEHQFIDEFYEGKLCDRLVNRASDISSFDACFIIAISNPVYAENAISRLKALGVAPKKLLSLLFESELMMLDQMLCDDPIRFWTLVQLDTHSFIDLEEKFYPLLADSQSNDKPNIGFFYIGKGGGFRAHVADLPKQLAESYNVREHSDIASLSDNDCSYLMMSESRMLQYDWPDLVINPHFFACSPPQIPKLTMLHMMYDFLVHTDLVARVMQQSDTHYLFIPSRPSMHLHQQICHDYQLTNNLVLIPGGYPRLDVNRQKYAELDSLQENKKSIIYAPTLSSLVATEETQYTYSILDAVHFIPAILDTFPAYQVIFRPHPDDLVTVKQGIITERANAFRTLLQFCDTHPRCRLDDNSTDYISTFAQASVLISDTSAIAYSFALITQKPVIFYSSNQKKVAELMSHLSYIKDREKLGHCVDSVSGLIDCLKTSLENSAKNYNSFEPEQVIYNPDCSLNYLIDNLNYILDDKKHPDWWYWRDHC